MPYDARKKPGDLPENVRKLSPRQQRRWAATWNNAYKRCIQSGQAKGACESRAFAIANGGLRDDGPVKSEGPGE